MSIPAVPIDGAETTRRQIADLVTYRKTGFTDCGERLWMSLPTAAAAKI